MKKSIEKKPTWSDLKRQLAALGRPVRGLQLGWGAGDNMDDLMAEYEFAKE
jgi:hypothetical protein